MYFVHGFCLFCADYVQSRFTGNTKLEIRFAVRSFEFAWLSDQGLTAALRFACYTILEIRFAVRSLECAWLLLQGLLTALRFANKHYIYSDSCREYLTNRNINIDSEDSRKKIIGSWKRNVNTWFNGHIGALLMASVYFAQPIRCRGSIAWMSPGHYPLQESLIHPNRPKGDNDMKIAK